MSYAIGATYPPTTLSLPQPFPAQYTPWTRVAGQNGQGKPVPMGPPTIEWRWQWLLYADVQTLLALCGTEPSAQVYLTTRMDDGTFADFYAVMWRPESSPLIGLRRGNVLVRFTQVEPVPFVDSAEVGDVAANKVVVTYNALVSASNYATGITIKVDGVSATISATARQTNHAIVHYTLSASVTAGQTVTIQYSKATGDYAAELSSSEMQDFGAVTVTNNV